MRLLRAHNVRSCAEIFLLRRFVPLVYGILVFETAFTEIAYAYCEGRFRGASEDTCSPNTEVSISTPCTLTYFYTHLI